MIIGICGFIGCGKDTVADYLINQHEFKRDSFANNLKDAVSVVFGWDRELLEGRSKEARDWREEVDTWWANKLNMPTLTPRWILQYWGTEVARKGFHNDIWVYSLEKKLENISSNVVITDCRFPNEINSIKNAGGKIVWVQRGDLPSWFELGKEGAKGNVKAKDTLEVMGVHSSEWMWLNTEFDKVLDNNNDFLELYNQIEDFLEVSN